MELREWLIILGLALVSLIVVDGVRRLQRQRRVPRLDQAVKDLPEAKLTDLDDEAKEAEINWELPNGGARVVKPADYTGLGSKPKLERQDHPGPSRVLSEFRRSFANAVPKRKTAAAPPAAAKHAAPTASRAAPAASPAATSPTDYERREPSFSLDSSSDGSSNSSSNSASNSEPSATHAKPAKAQAPHEHTKPMPTAAQESPSAPAPAQSERHIDEPSISLSATNQSTTDELPVTDELTTGDAEVAAVNKVDAVNEVDKESVAEPALSTAATPAEPVLRAEPEDAVFAKQDTPKRRQLREDTVGEYDELNDDEVDEYRLVDFEGIGRSFKRRLIIRRKEKARKKAEKAIRAEALAKQKAERKALEAEQRREAKEAAEAEKARIAQEQAEAREAAALAAAQKAAAPRYDEPEPAYAYDQPVDEYESYEAYDDAPVRAQRDSVVRTHPTLEKALRHDVSGEHAKETLSNADEVIVISVLSRDPEGFDGSKLLDLIMACGLRYSRPMGVFHRFETESPDSELQFSMINVVKPGTFPIEEMGEFVTPGVTFLMPLPGAVDSSAAFEAMVETAMVVVRHMGGELKDEHRSVMTAQTIEFARQRVRDFERRHRLHRHMQAH
ncbi:cell division protein ZipA [Vreelandella zhanjiangensis]|uniref:cell division protein ZipA n=1 Tax=Vreelandella zhanjiangensis TaxID=1121960 RepID=UPI0003766B15|nr:cell division protein ZipA [Halomonas zhanjiangensis]